MILLLYYMSFCATFKMCILIYLRGCCQVDIEEKVEVTDTEEEVKEETQNEEVLDKPDLETRFNEMMALVTQLQNDVSQIGRAHV